MAMPATASPTLAADPIDITSSTETELPPWDTSSPQDRLFDDATSASAEFEKFKERFGNEDSLLDWWRRTSGMHTVEDWCWNYNRHPGGMTAMLMIHGQAEVSSRLRSKVESYAIYSALFLSVSLPSLTTSGRAILLCEDASELLLCEIRKRIFLYSLLLGSAAHILCILISMSFVNALNEAARDSDVFRMFARGNAYLATVRCMHAFLWGILLNAVAVGAFLHFQLGLEGVVVCLVCAVGVIKAASLTTDKLFTSGSIIKYWRKDKGGKPDDDDPYDLRIPALRNRDYCRASREDFASQPASSAAATAVESTRQTSPLMRRRP